MKLAIPIKSNSLAAEISEKFSRSPYFAILDKNTGSIEFVENLIPINESGAGKKVVEFLYSNDVSVFVAFEIGLKVQQIAFDKKIQIILLDSKNKTLKSILKYIAKSGQ